MIDNVFELNDPVMRPGVNDVTVNGVSVLTSGNVADIKIPILYGTCDTAADTAAKVAVIDGFDTLKEGMTVHIKFTYSNGAVDPTLAIKSSSSATTTTTAKSIMVYGTTAPGSWNLTSWEPNQVVSFTYDGTYWQMNDRPSQLGASYFYNGLGIHIVADGSDPGISVSQAGYSSSSLDRESLSISTMNRGSISITADDIKIDNTSIVNKVSQVESTANGDYEVILANSTGTTTTKAGVKKSQYLTFNPSTKLLTLGTSGDIALPSGDTWDGTNTSLKDTIGAINNYKCTDFEYTYSEGIIPSNRQVIPLSTPGYSISGIINTSITSPSDQQNDYIADKVGFEYTYVTDNSLIYKLLDKTGGHLPNVDCIVKIRILLKKTNS